MITGVMDSDMSIIVIFIFLEVDMALPWMTKQDVIWSIWDNKCMNSGLHSFNIDLEHLNTSRHLLNSSVGCLHMHPNL